MWDICPYCIPGYPPGMNVTVKLVHTIDAHTKDINGVAFSNRYLASCSGDKLIRLWDLVTWEEAPCSPLKGHTYYVNHVVFSPFNTILASCSTDGRVIFWDPNNGHQIGVFLHPGKAGIRVGCFSLNSQLFASGSEDGSICLWDIPSKSMLRVLTGHEGSVLALSFSPDSLYVVSGTSKGDLRIWDAKFGHGKPLFTLLDCHDLGVSAMDIRASMEVHDDQESQTNCYLVATGGFDNVVRLWALTSSGSDIRLTFLVRATLSGHTHPIMSTRFSPNGRLLASCSGDHTVRLWDPETYVCLHVIDAHSRYVTSCCFSNDGKFIATGSNDRLVRVWSIDLDDEWSVDNSDIVSSADVDLKTSSHWSPILAWTADHVSRFLSQLGLGQYSTAFYQQAVDGQVLVSLTDRQLQQELGISVLGHRKKILQTISELQKTTLVEADTNLNDEFTCPVTHEIMLDPVVAADGYTYERSAIQAWLQQRQTSPMTNQPMGPELVPNRALRALIHRYLNEAS